MIQSVKEVRSELERRSFSYRKELEKRQIEVCRSRPDYVVPLLVAELAHARLDVARRVAPECDGLIWRIVSIANLVRAFRMVAARVREIRCANVEGKTALHGEYVAHLPSADHFVGQSISRAKKAPAVAYGKDIYAAE